MDNFKGQKRRVTRKGRKSLREESEVVSWRKRVVEHRQKRMLEDRGALPREDGENFLSSWLREDVEGNEEEKEKMNKEPKEEDNRIGKRDVVGAGEGVEIHSKKDLNGSFGLS